MRRLIAGGDTSSARVEKMKGVVKPPRDSSSEETTLTSRQTWSRPRMT